MFYFNFDISNMLSTLVILTPFPHTPIVSLWAISPTILSNVVCCRRIKSRPYAGKGDVVELTFKIYRTSKKHYQERRKCSQSIKLSLWLLQTHFDAIAADDFWKHCGQRWNCSSWAISPLSTMFSTLYYNWRFLWRFFRFLSPCFQSRLLQICCM